MSSRTAAPCACDRVPDPLDTAEAAQRHVHADLPALPLPALLAEHADAMGALALLAPTRPRCCWRRLLARDWWAERTTATAAELRRRRQAAPAPARRADGDDVLIGRALGVSR